MMQRLLSILVLLFVCGCGQSDDPETKAAFAFLPIYPGVTEVAYLPPSGNPDDPAVIYTAPASVADVQHFYKDALTNGGWHSRYSMERGQDTFGKGAPPLSPYTSASYKLEISYEPMGPTETRVSFRQLLEVGFSGYK